MGGCLARLNEIKLPKRNMKQDLACMQYHTVTLCLRYFSMIKLFCGNYCPVATKYCNKEVLSHEKMCSLIFYCPEVSHFQSALCPLTKTYADVYFLVIMRPSTQALSAGLAHLNVFLGSRHKDRRWCVWVLGFRCCVRPAEWRAEQ